MATANPFANVGLSQFGQDSSFTSGSKDGIGNFILGAALSSLGVPPNISKGLTGKSNDSDSVDLFNPVFRTPNQNGFMPGGSNSPTGSVPPIVDASTEPVVPNNNTTIEPASNVSPEQARNQFGMGFRSLFSHIPFFGVK